MRPAPRRLRVLVNGVHARAGGGLTYLRNLLPLLAAQDDLEIHLVPHPDAGAAFDELPGNIAVHRLNVPRGWGRLLLWEQIVLPFRARRIGYDIMLSAANFGLLLAPAQIVVIQNALTVGRVERRLAKRLYWFALRIMTLLSLLVVRRAIAVSSYAASAASSRWLPLAVPTIVPYGVAALFSPAPAEAPDRPFLFAVADLYIQKNLLNLVEALALLRRRHPLLTLRIAGAEIDAEYAAMLRRRIAELGLADAVLLIGRRPPRELVALYRSCAAFVFPSTEESFGIPLLEAMACGAPIAAAMSAAAPEIAGGAALLFAPEDPASMAVTIQRILDDPALREDLGVRGRARSAAFSWERCARDTAAVLRAAAGR